MAKPEDDNKKPASASPSASNAPATPAAADAGKPVNPISGGVDFQPADPDAPKLDETVPGGRYFVGGEWQDANGKPYKKRRANDPDADDK